MRRIGFLILCLGLVLVGLGCSKSPRPVVNVPPGAVVVHQPASEDIGRDNVLLTWSQSDAADFSSYEVHEVPDVAAAPGDSTLKAIIGGRSSTVYRVTGLTPETWHVFKVRTVTRSGSGSLSNAVRVLTTGIGVVPPLPVTLLPPVDLSWDRVIIRWTANREHTFDRYVIYRSTSPGFEPFPADSFGVHLNASDTQTVVMPLHAETQFYFKIAVYNFANKRSLSNEIGARTLKAGDIWPPPTPIVTVGTVTNTTVQLNWTPCTPDTLDWASYKVLADTTDTFAPKDETKLLVTIHQDSTGQPRYQATYKATHLLPDKQYFFMVLSFDESNNFSASRYASARTRPPVNPLFKFGGYGNPLGRFLTPSAVVIDSRGRAIVANTGNSRVDVFTNPIAGDTSLVATWTRAPEGDGLSLPEGVTLDASDTVYVADTGKNRIVVFSPDGEAVRALGGFGSDSASFNGPTALALDSGGDLWVCDRLNDRVKVLDPSGRTRMILPKSGQPAMTRPSGICFEPTRGEIYIVEQDRHRVARYDLEGTRLGEFGDGPGSGAGVFNRPTGICTDGQGHLFIADTGNDRFQVYRVGGRSPINVFGTYGLTGSDDDIKAGQLVLREPRGMAVLGDGAVVLDTDNTRAVVVNMTLSSLLENRGRRLQRVMPTIPARAVRR